MLLFLFSSTLTYLPEVSLISNLGVFNSNPTKVKVVVGTNVFSDCIGSLIAFASE